MAESFALVSTDAPEDRAVYLIALARVKGLGTLTLRRLFDLVPQFRVLWRMDQRRLLELLRQAKAPNPSESAKQFLEERPRLLDYARKQLNVLSANNIRLLVKGDPDFPRSMTEVPDPPRWLFVHGDASLLHRMNTVALVGTRDPTSTGLMLAETLARELVREGVIVISGLAEGIDEAAHRTVVDKGGLGIAVLGTGLFVTFPAATAEIRARLVSTGGVLVTEYFPHTTYNRSQFVERNRIIAGLAQVVIPIQGQSRSGTIHTVRYAEQIGRPVVGVTIGEAAKVPQNEILSLLRQNNHEVIDLNKNPQRLWREILGHVIERGKEDKAELTPARKFAPVLREIERLARRDDIKRDDLEWLVNWIRDIRSTEDEEEEQAKNMVE